MPNSSTWMLFQRAARKCPSSCRNINGPITTMKASIASPVFNPIVIPLRHLSAGPLSSIQFVQRNYNHAATPHQSGGLGARSSRWCSSRQAGPPTLATNTSKTPSSDSRLSRISLWRAAVVNTCTFAPASIVKQTGIPDRRQSCTDCITRRVGGCQ